MRNHLRNTYIPRVYEAGIDRRRKLFLEHRGPGEHRLEACNKYVDLGVVRLVRCKITRTACLVFLLSGSIASYVLTDGTDGMPVRTGTSLSLEQNSALLVGEHHSHLQRHLQTA